VTGAAHGIGRAVAERFVAEGARVAAVDVDGAALADLGDGILPITADVAQPADNVRAVAETVAAFGRLDTLVANAGLFDGNRALTEIEPEQLSRAFDELYGVNVKGMMLGARAAVPELAQSGGSIVMTASFASFHPSGGGVLYTTSKHAVLGLVRQLAYELAPDVRVNGVAPGVAPTRMRPAPALEEEPRDAVLPGTAESLPLGVVPDPGDFASLYVLLASREEGRAITGSVLEADSGLGVRGIGRPAGGYARAAQPPAVTTT
jgi:NAD(P)-dependent dehydrogenase (short-subunit alcohol dehydrogenase family)